MNCLEIKCFYFSEDILELVFIWVQVFCFENTKKIYFFLKGFQNQNSADSINNPQSVIIFFCFFNYLLIIPA